MTWPTAVAVAIIVATGSLAGRASWIDARTHRLPNALVLPCYPIVVIGLAVLTWLGQPEWLGALLGALAWTLPTGLLWLLGGRSGMGPGDVKLAAPLGATLGLLAPSIALLGVALAFAAGGLVALARMVRGGRGVRVPFGPWMIVGWCTALVSAVVLGSVGSVSTQSSLSTHLIGV